MRTFKLDLTIDLEVVNSTPPTPRKLPSDMSEVLPRLYIGGERARPSVSGKTNFLVIDVSNTKRKESEKLPGVVYHPISGINDDGTCSLSSHFAEVAQLIHAHLATAGNKVLVHCQAGISRSSTLIIAYLMISRLWSYDLANAHLQEAHPKADPKTNFVEQLQELQETLTLIPEAVAVAESRKILDDLAAEDERRAFASYSPRFMATGGGSGFISPVASAAAAAIDLGCP